jgi:CHAT domain-containing protein
MKAPFVLLFSLPIFFASSVYSQKSIQKKFSGIEELEQRGKTKRAYKKSEQVLNSILSTGEREHDAAISAYLLRARLQIETGRHFEYEKNINEALKLAQKLYGDTGRVLCQTYLSAAETHYQYGQYRKAEGMLRSAQTSYSKSKAKYEGFFAEYLSTYAKVNAKLGYLTRADSAINAALPILQKRIATTISGFDSKGRPKQIKLSKAEIAMRKEAYALATSTRAYIAYDFGNANKADSLFAISDSWIIAQGLKKSRVYGQNLSLEAKMEEEKGQLRNANNLYAKSFSAVKNRQDASYFNAFDNAIYGKMIKDEFRSVPRKDLTVLERKTKLYDNKANVFNVNKEILDEWFTAKKYKFNQVEYRLDKLMVGTRFLPKYHPSRIWAHSIYFILDSRSKMLTSIEDTLWSTQDQMKELYGENTPAYHRKKLDLAEFYFKKTNYWKKAEDIYEESFEKVVKPEMSPSHEKYVWLYNDMGSLYALSESLDKASENLTIAEKQAKINFGPESPKYAIALSNLASVYLSQGKYKSAKEMFERAESILNKGDIDEYTPTYALAYQSIAEGYSTFGIFDKAQRCLGEAEAIMEQNEKKGYDPAENSSPDDLAAFYILTGKYRLAEKILKQSIFEKEKARGKQARELIKPLNLIGKLYYTTGDYGQSEIYINRAAKISSAVLGDSSLKFAESLKIQHKLNVAYGDYEKADLTCKKQIQITERILGRNNVNMADALADWAIIRYNLGGSVDQSRKMLLESNTIIKSQLGADNPFYINGLKNLAFFQMETNRLSSADSLISIAEKYWESKLGKENIYTPEFDVMRGDLLRRQSKNDLAIKKYDDALDLYKKMFSDKHPEYIKTLSKMAKAYYAKGDYKNALSAINTTTQGYYEFIAKYFPVLSFGEKSKFWDLIKGDFEFFNSLALRMKDQNPDLIGQMYDYELATKALLLSNSIKVRQRILSSGNPKLVEQFNTWNDKKELFTKTLSYSSDQLRKENIDQKKLEEEITQLEKNLSASSEEFAKSFENKSIRWKDVKKALKEKEAAVEILRFRYYTTSFTDSIIYAALIVTGETNSNPELVVLGNGKELEKKYIKYYRNTIKYMNEDEVSYDVFWKPIDVKLKNYSLVYLSCEGVYNQINVETLKDDAEKYLIDKYTIVLLSNTKDLAMSKLYEKKNVKKQGANTIALIGNPQFYTSSNTSYQHSIPQLQGAETEAKEISDLYGSNKWKNNLLIRIQADEEKVKVLESPKILHVATHGYFQPDFSSTSNDENSVLKKNEINPLFRSGILLAGAGDLLDNNFTVANVNGQNGILTAYEAMNMNLDGTELVTLSACETGLGDIQIGEGVAGLQRSFLVAGADNVVMSLFKVNDEITEKLMLTFYDKWIKLGDKRKAFVEAKKEIKAQFPASIYWGSFIMIGVN